MTRLVIFGGSYAESQSHQDQTAWQHQCQQHIGANQLINHAGAGTSVRWSLAKLIEYFNTDHLINDYILFFVSDHDALPFMDSQGQPQWAANLGAWLIGKLPTTHPAHKYFDDRADIMRWIAQHYQQHHIDCQLIQSFLSNLPNSAFAIPCTNDGYAWPYEYHMGKCHDDHNRTRLQQMNGATSLHKRFVADGEETVVMHNHMAPERHTVFAQHMAKLLLTQDVQSLQIEDMREVSRNFTKHDPVWQYPD